MRAPRRWAHFAVLALFAAAVAVCLWEVAVQGQVYVGVRDRVQSELPYVRLASEALAEGRLPWWNRLTLCGYIGLGQHVLRLLHPLNLPLWFAGPGDVAWVASWRIAVELFLLLAAAYAFQFRLWKDPALAAFGAAATGLSIASFALIAGGHSVNPFLPLLLWAAWEAPSSRPERAALALAGALFLQLATGNFQVTAYALPPTVALSAARAWMLAGTLRDRNHLRLAGAWACAAALALLLDGLELFPLIEAQRLSNRTTVPFPEMQAMFGQPAYLGLRLALPHFLGGFADFALVERNWSINYGEALPAYSGAATFLLALIAAFGPAPVWARAAAAAMALVALCGLRTPFAWVPYLLYGRAPLVHGRIGYVIPFALGLLAPVGLRAYLQADADRRHAVVAWLAAVVLTAAGLCGAWLGPELSLRALLPSSNWQVLSGPGIDDRLAEAGWTFLAFGGGAVALLAAHAFRRLGEGGLKWGLVAVVVADLVFSARRHALLKEFSPRGDWYAESGLTRTLRALPGLDRWRLYLLPGVDWADLPGGRTYAPSMNFAYGLPDVGGFATFIHRRYAELAGKGDGRSFRVTPHDFVDEGWLADLLSVRYIVAPATARSRALYGRIARPLATHGGAELYERAAAPPRWRLACRVLDQPSGIDEFVARARAEEGRLGDGVFLEGGRAFLRAPPSCPAEGDSSLELREPHSGRLEGRVRLARPAVLVFSETFLPGWRARIDGRPASLLRANWTFMALELPAGESAVELAYEPTSRRLALFGLASALLAAALAAAWSWRRR